MAERLGVEIAQLEEQRDPESGRVLIPAGWAFRCVPRQLCGFQSLGWPDETAATNRAAEHVREHRTGELMTELHEFGATEDLRIAEAAGDAQAVSDATEQLAYVQARNAALATETAQADEPTEPDVED